MIAKGEKPLVIGAPSGQNGSSRHGETFRSTGRTRLSLSLLIEKGFDMDTALVRPHRQNGPVFVREIHQGALVLCPHSPLGNLNESDITAETAELLEVINHSGPTYLVIDLQNGEYMGTAFLGAVVRLWKRVALRGGRLGLCNISDQVFQILRVTKFHTMWPIYPTRDDAVRSIGAG